MWPLLPTSFAVIAGSPRQVAMSRTLEPTLISARSINRLVTFSAPLSIDFYHAIEFGTNSSNAMA